MKSCDCHSDRCKCTISLPPRTYHRKSLKRLEQLLCAEAITQRDRDAACMAFLAQWLVKPGKISIRISFPARNPESCMVLLSAWRSFRANLISNRSSYALEGDWISLRSPSRDNKGSYFPQQSSHLYFSWSPNNNVWMRATLKKFIIIYLYAQPEFNRAWLIYSWKSLH